MEKKCCICKEYLPVEKFKTNNTRPDGLQSQCISCQKEYRRQHYLENRQKYIAKAKKRREEFFRWWKDYKRTFSCVRCGENHPACICFHHPNDDKEGEVSRLVADGNKSKVLREIAKCVPLCLHCHAKEHWKD